MLRLIITALMLGTLYASKLQLATVNSEFFARILFSRKGEIILSFIDIGKSSPSREFLTSQI